MGVQPWGAPQPWGARQPWGTPIAEAPIAEAPAPCV